MQYNIRTLLFRILIFSYSIFSAVNTVKGQCANTYSIIAGRLVLVWTTDPRPPGLAAVSFDGKNYNGTNSGNYQWLTDANSFSQTTSVSGPHTLIIGGTVCSYINGALPTDETKKLLEQLAQLKKDAELKDSLAKAAELSKKEIEEKKRQDYLAEKAKQEAEEKARLDAYEESKKKAQLEAEEKRKKEEAEKQASIDEIERKKKEAAMQRDSAYQKSKEEERAMLDELERKKKMAGDSVRNRLEKELKAIADQIEQMRKDAKEKARLEEEANKKARLENKQRVDSVISKAKEEKARMDAEEERLKKQAEETKKLLAEIEKLKRDAERKAQIINEAEQAKKEKEDRDRRKEERKKQEAEEKVRREELLVQSKNSTPPTNGNIAISKEDAERIKKENAIKEEAALISKQEDEVKAKAEAEERKKKAEEEKIKIAEEEKAKAAAPPQRPLLSPVTAPPVSSVDCEDNKFLDDLQELADFEVMNRYNLTADQGTQQDYSVVLSADYEYVLVVNSGRNGTMIATVLDRDSQKPIVSSTNKSSKTNYSKISFLCKASGVYQLKFSFATEVGCGVCIFGKRR